MKGSLSIFAIKHIESRPYLRYALDEHLINYSALARQIAINISKDSKRKINEDSLIVAIKRYADRSFSSIAPSQVRGLMGQSSLSMQDNIAYALVNNTRDVFEEINNFFRKADWHFNEIRVLLESSSHTGVVVNTEKMNQLIDKIGRPNFYELKDNCSIITLRPPEKAFEISGFLNELTLNLTKEDVNSLVLSIPPEIHFIVGEKEGAKTYSIFKKMIADCTPAVIKAT